MNETHEETYQEAKPKYFTAPVDGVYKISPNGIKLVKRLKKGESLDLETGRVIKGGCFGKRIR